MEENNKYCCDIYLIKEIVRDNRLNANEKFYMCLYRQFNNNEFDADMSMRTQVSKQTLCSIKKKLKKLNYLENKPQDIEPLVAKEKVIKNKGIGQKCEWCGIYTMALQEHHFPIPRCKGGKDVVKICPNCHCEYHLICKEK